MSVTNDDAERPRLLQEEKHPRNGLYSFSFWPCRVVLSHLHFLSSDPYSRRWYSSNTNHKLRPIRAVSCQVQDQEGHAQQQQQLQLRVVHAFTLVQRPTPRAPKRHAV